MKTQNKIEPLDKVLVTYKTLFELVIEKNEINRFLTYSEMSKTQFFMARAYASEFIYIKVYYKLVRFYDLYLWE